MHAEDPPQSLRRTAVALLIAVAVLMAGSSCAQIVKPKEATVEVSEARRHAEQLIRLTVETAGGDGWSTGDSGSAECVTEAGAAGEDYSSQWFGPSAEDLDATVERVRALWVSRGLAVTVRDEDGAADRHAVHYRTPETPYIDFTASSHAMIITAHTACAPTPPQVAG